MMINKLMKFSYSEVSISYFLLLTIKHLLVTLIYLRRRKQEILIANIC